jgi:serine/threonine protein kinase
LLTKARLTLKRLSSFLLNSQQFRNIRDVDAVRNELGVMQSLRHPNIIDMLDVIYRDGKFYIILECANGGDMRDYIVAQVRGFEAYAWPLLMWPYMSCKQIVAPSQAISSALAIVVRHRRLPETQCQRLFQQLVSEPGLSMQPCATEIAFMLTACV